MIQYYGRSLLILKVKAGDSPYSYDGRFYERHGTDLVEIKPDQYADLFKRFFQRN
jgi:predicted HTH transcriptional regulator